MSLTKEVYVQHSVKRSISDFTSEKHSLLRVEVETNITRKDLYIIVISSIYTSHRNSNHNNRKCKDTKKHELMFLQEEANFSSSFMVNYAAIVHH